MEEQETYLSDWLDGSMNDQALKALVGEAEFREYQSITDELNRWKAPVFQGDLTFLEQPKNKEIPVRALWVRWSVAASVLLAIGLFVFQGFSKQVIATTGEELVYVLPDQSTATLSPGSELSFSSWGFAWKRTISLRGQAFFKVAKGATFTVESDQGFTQVLGTEFTVHSRGNYYQVRCFEGSVEVKIDQNKFVLAPYQWVDNLNQAVERFEGAENSPLSYWSVPLSVVLADIEAVYGVEIDRTMVQPSWIFTGKLDHDNLNQALNQALWPFNLEYKFVSEHKILLRPTQ